MMLPNYSVLMSVYHKEKPEYLRESIDSILAQTIVTDDFVIVCDGPLTKELDEVLKAYEEKESERIHLVRLAKNQGLGPALNEGLKHCRNEIVARMDSDDISLPDRCQRELEVMEQGYDIVSGTIVEFSRSVEHLGAKRQLPVTSEAIQTFARKRNPFNHPCVMFRKEAVLLAGSYQACDLYEDYYLWARMLMNGAKGYNIYEPILYMRAGEDMYKRRGGVAYLKSMVHFRKCLRKMGFISGKEYMVAVIGHGVVCLMPNGLRTFLYAKLLRKK